MPRDEERETLISDLQSRMAMMDLDEIAEALADCLWSHQFEELVILVRREYDRL